MAALAITISLIRLSSLVIKKLSFRKELLNPKYPRPCTQEWKFGVRVTEQWSVQRKVVQFPSFFSINLLPLVTIFALIM